MGLNSESDLRPANLQSNTMKLSANIFMSFLCGASAFTPSRTTVTRHSQLNLFGGGSKAGSSENKGPGMMDQLAMFKKAQEIAQKKQKLDKELAGEKFEGSTADGKVTVSFKYSPPKNPMDPQPDYEATSFDFDEEWFDGATPEELSASVVEAYNNGIAKTSEAVAEKYKLLQEDLANLQN